MKNTPVLTAMNCNICKMYDAITYFVKIGFNVLMISSVIYNRSKYSWHPLGMG